MAQLLQQQVMVWAVRVVGAAMCNTCMMHGTHAMHSRLWRQLVQLELGECS
jgi:hypothetical protein